MNGESLVKYYEGNKSFRSEPPIPFIAAGTSNGNLFAEHFIVTGWDKVPLVDGSCSYFGREEDPASLEALKSITVEEAFESQLAFARDGFEDAIGAADPELQRGFFWAGYLFKFHEIEQKQVLRRMRMWILLRQHTKELDKMCQARSSLSTLTQKLGLIARIGFNAVRS